MKKKAIAKETMEVLKRGRYRAPSGEIVDLRSALADCEAGTRLFRPEEGEALVADLLAGAAAAEGVPPTRTEVVNETTIEGARRLLRRKGESPGRLGLLNFASAKNPGGGFLKGAHAQEESLARSSGLYPSLLRARAYYDFHRNQVSCFYSDHIIYSPGCPFFRDDAGDYFERPLLVDVVTSPAPNAGVIRSVSPDRVTAIPGCLETRATKVLAVFLQAKCRHIVLGAWGCGVFQNDPEAVAGAFHRLLAPGGAFDRRFDAVTFSVLDRSGEQRTFHAFATRFGAGAAG